MGTTFSNIQIKNLYKLNPDKLKESLYIYFEKKGMSPATQDDFQLSYRLTFSNKSDWISLISSEYEPGLKRLQEDAKGIAKALGTYCISMSVLDSDALFLDLYGPTAKKRDTILDNMKRQN